MGVKKKIQCQQLQMKISRVARGEDKRQQRDGAAGENLPVFSLISHKTLKRAGFILWQFSACFLKRGQDATFNISPLTKHTTHRQRTAVCVRLQGSQHTVWEVSHTADAKVGRMEPPCACSCHVDAEQQQFDFYSLGVFASSSF